MMNDSKPSILIVSSNNVEPRTLMKSITQNTVVKEDGPHRLSQTWKIDTKYYTAEVDIYIVNEYYERSDDFNQAVKALIIHMDCDTETELIHLTKWKSVENECNPEIKLLVSNCNDQTKPTLNTITEWCINHGYEFINLHSTAEMTAEEEDEIIKEKFGVDRIIEALHTYIWPNLEMKTFQISRNNQKKSDILSNEQINKNISLDDILFEDGMDDFTELFSQLHMMKESIQSMSGVERKYHAEQMVTAFWKAIDGDDEEIEDL